MDMVKRFTFNHFGVNTYIIFDQDTKECAVVDPAAKESFEDAQLTQYFDEHQFTPTMILLTHAHIDHIAGLKQICQTYNLPVTMHPDGLKLIKQAQAYASMLGFDIQSLDELAVQPIQDNDTLTVGNIAIECRYVPGHCPGSMCYVLHDEQIVLTGDALFCGSIGRTDLPGGDYPLLIEKIKTRLLTLPDNYLVLPGHGETTNIYDEKHHNGFLV
mgnify:CR=1 FL=1